MFSESVLSDDRGVVLDIVESDAEHIADEGLASIEAVLRLFEVVCVLAVVDCIFYLIDTWQWVENLHVFLAFSQHVSLEDIGIFHSLILHEVSESFALHSCHVEDVGVCYSVFGEVLLLNIFDAFLLAVELVFLWHFQLLWGDEVEGGEYLRMDMSRE